jgi:DNA mismatch repair protein MutS
MAGMPGALVDRANEILKHLETQHVDEGQGDNDPVSIGSGQKEKIRNISSPQLQLSIFDAHTETFEEIRNILEGLDINRLTPVEALLKLQEIKNLLH